VPRPDGRLGVISDADLLHNGGQLAEISAGEVAHDGASSVRGGMPLSDAVRMLKSGEVEIFVIGAAGSPTGTLTAADVVRYMAGPPLAAPVPRPR
jgi:predicted transcriptional regulator